MIAILLAQAAQKPDLISDQTVFWLVGGLCSVIWTMGQALALSKLGALSDALKAHSKEEETRDAANADKLKAQLDHLTTTLGTLATKVDHISDFASKISEWRLSVDRRLEFLEKRMNALMQAGVMVRPFTDNDTPPP